MRFRLFSFLLLFSFELTCQVVTLRAHEESADTLASLDALIVASPEDVDLYLRRASNHEARGERIDAASDLLRAAKLSPDSAEVALASARLKLASAQLDAAHLELDALLHRTPGLPDALVLRAQLHRQLGDHLAAHADYSRALDALTAPSPDLFLARAALQLPPALALAGIDEGLARLGPAVPLLERACELAQRLGRTDTALSYLDQIAAHTDRRELLLRRSGEILVAAGRPAEARAVFSAALAYLAAQPDWVRASPEAHDLTATLTRSLTSVKSLQ